jgi:hypothetical protein
MVTTVRPLAKVGRRPSNGIVLPVPPVSAVPGGRGGWAGLGRLPLFSIRACGYSFVEANRVVLADRLGLGEN